jgi:polyisoprenoid-binding protein YceI
MRASHLLLMGVVLATGGTASQAAEYQIDPAHSFVQFKIQHLGYSWLHGRFDAVSGTLRYDAGKPSESAIQVTVDTGSINSNFAKRDEHLRSADFLEVAKFPQASFKSTGFKGDAKGGTLSGILSLHGVEKPIQIEVTTVGEGKDPWGGYRAGFTGSYAMTRKDFGITHDLGPSAEAVQLEFGIEGIRQ